MDVLALKVKCRMNAPEGGCTWTGSVGDYEVPA